MARKTTRPTGKAASKKAVTGAPRRTPPGGVKRATKSAAARRPAGEAAAKPPAGPVGKTAAQTASEAPASEAPAARAAGAVPVLRRKELVARIVASSGLKPNAVKSALDAVLDEIGKAVAAGEALNLPPLGKLTVNRSKVVGDRQVMICKLRRKIGENSAPAPLDNPAQ